jgi:hypothetical protein
VHLRADTLLILVLLGLLGGTPLIEWYLQGARIVVNLLLWVLA